MTKHTPKLPLQLNYNTKLKEILYIRFVTQQLIFLSNGIIYQIQ